MTCPFSTDTFISSRANGHARAFFGRYADRLIYGTDTTTGGMVRDGEQAVERALGRARAVRTFLETDVAFTPPEGLDHWLQPDLLALQGLALPRDILTKIYRTNVERLYGSAPARLDLEAGLELVRQMAAALDEQAGGYARSNHARQALEVLAHRER